MGTKLPIVFGAELKFRSTLGVELTRFVVHGLYKFSEPIIVSALTP